MEVEQDTRMFHCVYIDQAVGKSLSYVQQKYKCKIMQDLFAVNGTWEKNWIKKMAGVSFVWTTDIKQQLFWTNPSYLVANQEISFAIPMPNRHLKIIKKQRETNNNHRMLARQFCHPMTSKVWTQTMLPKICSKESPKETNEQTDELSTNPKYAVSDKLDGLVKNISKSRSESSVESEKRVKTNSNNFTTGNNNPEMAKDANPQEEKKTNKKIDSVSDGKIQNLDMLSAVVSRIVENNVNGSEVPLSDADNVHFEGTASPAQGKKLDKDKASGLKGILPETNVGNEVSKKTVYSTKKAKSSKTRSEKVKVDSTEEQLRVSKIICPFDHFTLRNLNSDHKNTCHCILDDVRESLSPAWKKEIDLCKSKCQGRVAGEGYLSLNCLMGKSDTFPESVKYNEVHYCSQCRNKKRLKKKKTLWCNPCHLMLERQLLKKRKQSCCKYVYA